MLLFSCAIADEVRNVGIAKYAVLEVLQDRTPVRDDISEDAQRIGHFLKDTVLFADKQTDDYYRVEFEKDKYGWINKKDIEVQAIIPEKRYDAVTKMVFKEDKKNYFIDIQTLTKSAYLFEEGSNSLDFTLFDNRYDPYHLKIVNQRGVFKLPPRYDEKLNINYLNTKPLFGYDIIHSDKGYLLNIKKAPKINPKRPLKGIKIVIDPGHGGDEFGVESFGLKEKDINLKISKKLRREFKKKGAKVYMTRKHDKRTDLYSRIDFAKTKEADILLSIHQNSLPDPSEIEKKHGTGVYYYQNQSKPLAESIQKNMLKATGFQDDGVNYRSFALTRPTAQISVLVECGYLIYKPEAEKLINRKFQTKIAKAIVKGTQEYLTDSFSSKTF